MRTKVKTEAHLPFQLHWSLEYWQKEVRHSRNRASRNEASSVGLSMFISPRFASSRHRNYKKIHRRLSSRIVFPWAPVRTAPSALSFCFSEIYQSDKKKCFLSISDSAGQLRAHRKKVDRYSPLQQLRLGRMWRHTPFSNSWCIHVLSSVPDTIASHIQTNIKQKKHILQWNDLMFKNV